MQSPLEIAFHGLDPSPALEADIRAHVDRLERHQELVSCRVTLERGSGKGQPHHHVGVHIRLGLPGYTVEVSHDPHHEREHRAHADERTAVQDAFHVAERRLTDLRDRNRATHRTAEG